MKNLLRVLTIFPLIVLSASLGKAQDSSSPTSPTSSPALSPGGTTLSSDKAVELTGNSQAPKELVSGTVAALPVAPLLELSYDVEASLLKLFRLHTEGTPQIPDSSVDDPADLGVNSRTGFLIMDTGAPAGNGGGAAGPDAAAAEASSSVPRGENPQSIRAVYNLPNTGGSGVIVIVDAYHFPTALNDFNVFSKQFGLPVETSTQATLASNKVFEVVYAAGTAPQSNGGWNQEEALDIEWAHAMAPNAKIVLVEGASASYTDLLNAVSLASRIPGVKQVSMSWGGDEFNYELAYDSVFTTPGVTYVASSGDVGGEVLWPGTSPNVISAGGTTINRNSLGQFLSETAWRGGGGGTSLFEPAPIDQDVIYQIIGVHRGVPDVSFDANPSSGVAVYDSTSSGGYHGWLVFGGTSVSAPSLAGIINLAGPQPAAQPTQSMKTVPEFTWVLRNIVTNQITTYTSSENTTVPQNAAQPQLTDTVLPLIYKNLGSTNFRDITAGSNGEYDATKGWDFCTGVGTPLGVGGL